MIREHVSNSSFEGFTNVADVYISALRRKVDGHSPRKLIQTNRGVGYTFCREEGGIPSGERVFSRRTTRSAVGRK
jgi:DNA-binding response OmpR family regulator